MNNVPGSTPKIICSDLFLSIIALVISDKSADNNHRRTGYQYVVRPGLYLRDAQSGPNSQNHRSYNQYNC